VQQKAAAGLRHRRRLSRKAGVIRDPPANVAASREEDVMARAPVRLGFDIRRDMGSRQRGIFRLSSGK
jgi:hypothetical protein